MPEMPEVETIRRTLADKVTGLKIKQVKLLLPRLIKWPAPEEFQAMVTGKTIIRLERRGKYLLFWLDKDVVMVVHLRMTGRLYYGSTELINDRFARIIFALDDGNILLYADSRTLGTIYAMPAQELWRIYGLDTLGPEPLSPAFTPEYLQSALARKKTTVKAALLDQRIIGGLGNIYVDESLALAGIRPDRPSGGLIGEEISRLYCAINKVIQDGIAHGGTTFRDYRDGAGQSGRHQHHLYVYGRKGEPCRICGSLIERCEVAGRGTHYCPNCQK